MKEFFARLNPMERRFVVGVMVVFFIVINIVWVWPRFSDWGQTKTRMKTARERLALFEEGVAKVPGLQREIAKYQAGGEVVPPNDQAVSFVRLIQSEATKSSVIPASMSGQRQTGGTADNPFFVEQSETVTLQSSEKQLVDFLYNLGAGKSLIRVKVLSVQPDQTHQQLTTRVTLIASYQKKAAAPRAAIPAPAAAAKPSAALPKPMATNPVVPGSATTPKALTPIKK